jgi:hypothetical protein
MVLPERWTPEQTGIDRFEVITGPSVAGNPLNVYFYIEENDILFEMYAAYAQDLFRENLENDIQLSEAFLKTDLGEDYFRWTFTGRINGITVYNIGYVFDFDGMKVLALYTRPYSQGQSFDQVIDTAMRTMRSEK